MIDMIISVLGGGLATAIGFGVIPTSRAKLLGSSGDSAQAVRAKQACRILGPLVMLCGIGVYVAQRFS